MITRKGDTVSAFDDKGNVLRSVECRNIPNAVSLEAKLTNDPAFTDRWAGDGDPKAEMPKRHGLERPWRA